MYQLSLPCLYIVEQESDLPSETKSVKSCFVSRMALPYVFCTNFSPLSSKISYCSSMEAALVIGSKGIVPAVVVGKSYNSRASLRTENAPDKPIEEIPMFSRTSFPPGFTFGTSTAAYQVEGAASEYGREPSIWDTYAHNHPEKITDGSNGDTAVDQYHRYKEDIRLMKEMGMKAYRFSISWSRILPKGTIEGGVNQAGIIHYNNLINELLKNGIEPFVTILHFDLPQDLQDNYNGFLDRMIVNDYKAYAELCFEKFGDRVKHWITMNEPWVMSSQGYGNGEAPPSRCTTGCLVTGDSAKEPYIVTHNILLAHAAAVAVYREKYQAKQKGEIGITLVSVWPEPYDNSNTNVQASERWLDFMLGWFMEPLVTGDYPFIMKALVGNRLPPFTEKDRKMVKGSFDFIGLNYYLGKYAVSLPFNPNALTQSYESDIHVELKDVKDENDIPSNGPMPPNFNDPFPLGIYKLLLHIAQRYNNPPIYITENGRWQTDLFDGSLTMKEALNDKERIRYHESHLHKVLEAIRRCEVNVKGYFAWSLLDNFEWSDGFTKRFGLYYTDYNDNLKRYPKDSAKWFKRFLS